MKQLSLASQHGKSQFIAEIATISAVQHRNLVKLYGFCIKGNKRLLVYEYLENKSLDHSIFGMKMFLSTFIVHIFNGPLVKKILCIFKKVQSKTISFLQYLLIEPKEDFSAFLEVSS